MSLNQLAAATGIVDSMNIFPIEDRKRILEGEVESLAEKLEIMTDEKRVSTNNLRNVKLTLSSVKNECKMLQEENSEHLKNLESLTKENFDLIQAAKKDQEDLEKCELEITANEQDLIRIEDELGEKNDLIATQENKIVSLEAAIDKHGKEFVQLSEINESRAKECRESLEKKDKEIAESREMQRELSHQYKDCESDNERLRGEIEILRKEKEDLSLSQQVLKEEVGRLRAIVFQEEPQRNKKRKCFWCNW